MRDIYLPASGWAPRTYQAPLWRFLEAGGKRAIAVWHRRSGKDAVALHWGAVAAFEHVGNYWHMLPEAAQARKAIWEAVNPHTGRRRIDEAFPDDLCVRKRDTDMLIEFINGSTWQVVGSDNYNSLVGATPHGIVFSEYSIANPSAWPYMRPILEENGGWAVFIYTPRGRNHGATLYDAHRDDDDWFTERLTADQTGVFSAASLARELSDLVKENGQEAGQALFDQEYNVSFDAPILGAYYGAQMRWLEENGRIGNVPHDPALPVETWWDLGIGDSTVIWFAQRNGAEVRLIDCYAASGQDLGHYAKVVDEKRWTYSRHVAPHDIAVRELGSGKSRVETALALGIRFEIAPQLRVDDGIQAVRSLLPRCWFDRTRCSQGIEALIAYRRDYDEKHKVFRDKPLHDWSSDFADAFRMGAVSREDRGGFAPIKYRRVSVA